MKKILLFFMVFSIGANLFGQPIVKIFVFEQENLPGTKPTGVTDENGRAIKKAAAKKNYFVFLTFKKSYDIRPVKIFIRGKSFSIQTTTLKKTPVEYTNNTVVGNPEKTVLVPFTKNRVLELNITDTQAEEKKSGSIRNLTEKNDVVIGYIWNKKKYFATLEKIKKLEPVANE